MSLRNDAAALSDALNEIIRTAKGSRSEYVVELAERIAPLVDRYDRAVFHLHAREDASDALTSRADGMGELSSAATKGELQGFRGDSFESYWRLRTIFRESRYRDEAI
jgi:hypothetical protein